MWAYTSLTTREISSFSRNHVINITTFTASSEIGGGDGVTFYDTTSTESNAGGNELFWTSFSRSRNTFITDVTHTSTGEEVVQDDTVFVNNYTFVSFSEELAFKYTSSEKHSRTDIFSTDRVEGGSTAYTFITSTLGIVTESSFSTFFVTESFSASNDAVKQRFTTITTTISLSGNSVRRRPITTTNTFEDTFGLYIDDIPTTKTSVGNYTHSTSITSFYIDRSTVYDSKFFLIGANVISCRVVEPESWEWFWSITNFNQGEFISGAAGDFAVSTTKFINTTLLDRFEILVTQNRGSFTTTYLTVRAVTETLTSYTISRAPTFTYTHLNSLGEKFTSSERFFDSVFTTTRLQALSKLTTSSISFTNTNYPLSTQTYILSYTDELSQIEFSVHDSNLNLEITTINDFNYRTLTLLTTSIDIYDMSQYDSITIPIYTYHLYTNNFFQKINDQRDLMICYPVPYKGFKPFSAANPNDPAYFDYQYDEENSSSTFYNLSIKNNNTFDARFMLHGSEFTMLNENPMIRLIFSLFNAELGPFVSSVIGGIPLITSINNIILPEFFNTLDEDLKYTLRDSLNNSTVSFFRVGLNNTSFDASQAAIAFEHVFVFWKRCNNFYEPNTISIPIVSNQENFNGLFVVPRDTSYEFPS